MPHRLDFSLTSLQNHKGSDEVAIGGIKPWTSQTQSKRPTNTPQHFLKFEVLIESYGVKQSCVLASTLSGIFSLLQMHALEDSEDGFYVPSRSKGELFNFARLRTKSKVFKILITGMFLLAKLPSLRIPRRPCSD